MLVNLFCNQKKNIRSIISEKETLCVAGTPLCSRILAHSHSLSLHPKDSVCRIACLPTAPHGSSSRAALCSG